MGHPPVPRADSLKSSASISLLPRADSLEFCFESVFRHQTIEQGHALIAAERDEMQAALGLIADWFGVHLLQIVVGAVAHPSAKKTPGRVGQPRIGNSMREVPGS